MKRSLSKAQEFLNKVKENYEKPFMGGRPSVELFKKLPKYENYTDDKINKVIDELIHQKNEYNSSMAVSLRTKHELFSKFMPEFHNKFYNEKIAIGSLYHGNINAFCIKSSDGLYAILLNEGLMLLFNKLLSYYFAQTSLYNVSYCDRLPKEKLSIRIINEFINETITNFRSIGVPFGPVILLQKEGQVQLEKWLYVWESFVIFHELGHIFNGDLENKNNLLPFSSSSSACQFTNNSSKELEFNADVKGFGLMCKVFKENNFQLRLLLPAMIEFTEFLNLYELNSINHPPFKNRLLKILKLYYSEEIYNRVFNYYMNPKEKIKLSLTDLPNC